MLKKGKVTQVDVQKGMVKVLIAEESTESNWIPLLSDTYNLPAVGAMVRVLFEEERYNEGLCLGEYFSGSNPPNTAGAAVSYLKMAGDVVLKYDASSKSLEIFADSITVSGTIHAKNL
jgi:phage baseplate assembly protein gpV